MLKRNEKENNKTFYGILAPKILHVARAGVPLLCVSQYCKTFFCLFVSDTEPHDKAHKRLAIFSLKGQRREALISASAPGGSATGLKDLKSDGDEADGDCCISFSVSPANRSASKDKVKARCEGGDVSYTSSRMSRASRIDTQR